MGSGEIHVRSSELVITEKHMGKHIIKVDNGKYTFVLNDGWVLDVLRHGEPWVTNLDAPKAVQSMMAALDAARVVVEAARATVKRYENNVSVPGMLADALDLHDRLVDDRELPSSWAGSVVAQYAALAAEEQRAED